MTDRATQAVLGKLVSAKKRGITFSDFPVGFRLGARIFELRGSGFHIQTVREELGNGRYRARYVLLKRPA